MGQIACAMLMKQVSTGIPSPSVNLTVNLMLRNTTAPRASVATPAAGA
jgi:hypothetical protein